MECKHVLISGLILLLGFLLAAPTAWAKSLDDERDQVRQAISDGSNFTNTLASVVGMTIAPEIASAHFKIEFQGQDDVDLETTKIPIRHYFSGEGRQWDPFVQVTGGYMTASKMLREDDGGNLVLADRQHKGYSFFLLGGVRFPLGLWGDIAPTAGVGMARLENQTTPLNDYTRKVIMPIYSGIVGDYTIDTMALSAGLEMNARHKLGPVELLLALRYSHFYLQTTSVSDSALEFSQNSDITAVRLTAQGDLGSIAVFKCPILWQVFLGNTAFWGPDAESLGFSNYNELGATMGLDLAGMGLWLDAVRLGGSLISGDGITGWTIIFGYDF